MKALAITPTTSLDASPNPVAVYLASLGDGSRRTMLGCLNAIAGILSNGHADAMGTDWAQLRYRHTAAVRAALAERLSPASVNKSLSALRGVMAATWKLGYIDSDTYHRAVDVRPVSGSRLPAGRMLDPAEINDLYKACKRDRRNGVAGARDAAAIALLHSYGLRRSEVVALDLSDYHDGVVTVRGKGDKERRAFGFNGSSKIIAEWLRIRGTDPGPLLYPVTRLGEIVKRRMGSQSLYDKLRVRGEQAEIAGFSPHDFRRTYISTLLGKGIDLVTVSKMAGHANVQTTARYCRRSEQVQQDAALSIDVEGS